MGLPLLLMTEEIVWLVLKNLAILVPGKKYIESIYSKISQDDIQLLEKEKKDYLEDQLAIKIKQFEEKQIKLNRPVKINKDFLIENFTLIIPREPNPLLLKDRYVHDKSEELVSITNFLKFSATTYSIFQYLKSLDYFLLPGLRFGGRFIAYPGDPLRFHSHLIVNDFKYNENIDLIKLVRGGRLATGVKKAWLVASVIEGDEEKCVDKQKDDEIAGEEIACFSVEWAGFG
ncbi:hypothetical protein WICMUC_003950 [Wickerhamomyces mucosus]|uniref:tRNA-splicing endonuclease subunit SEN34 n=1 Tax=Wickerhamomyces mucosus TaxID=1378264 RepID=A0A9P8PJJ9_9ASCO|nr:hypothetical protein WICMUC_003950 [Wickerhamomyces mucosus]